MGVGVPTAKWLKVISAKHGVNFEKTVTLGRQEIIFDKKTYEKKLKKFYEIDEIFQKDRFSEALWSGFGARTIDAIDISDFEDATIIHDMNKEIPHEFRERWSCVIDCGTGEHIFNYHQAIKNMMDMLCVGGTLLLIIPTNNWMYHGYYQFCPDLFWELLNEKNGFNILDMTIQESKNGIDAIYRRVKYDFWYQPVEERHITKYPTQLFICARKIAPTPSIIELQQGYYEDAWKKGSRTKKNKESIKQKTLQIQKWWNKFRKKKDAIKEIEDEKYNIDKEWEQINSTKLL